MIDDIDTTCLLIHLFGHKNMPSDQGWFAKRWMDNLVVGID